MVPLVVKFSDNCVPLGCFGSIISCLLSLYDWEVNSKDDDSPECLAHNIASLFCPTLFLKVVLVDTADHILKFMLTKMQIVMTFPMFVMKPSEPSERYLTLCTSLTQRLKYRQHSCAPAKKYVNLTWLLLEK